MGEVGLNSVPLGLQAGYSPEHHREGKYDSHQQRVQYVQQFGCVQSKLGCVLAWALAERPATSVPAEQVKSQSLNPTQVDQPESLTGRSCTSNAIGAIGWH
jgi:hypothetical protein